MQKRRVSAQSYLPPTHDSSDSCTVFADACALYPEKICIAYSCVLEHLHQNALTSSDLRQIRKAVNFLMPMYQTNRQTQRELMGVNMKTTALLNTAR